MSLGNDDDTLEIPPPRQARDDRPTPFSALVQVDVAGLSHTGCVRPTNEDHYLICRFGRFFETIQTNLPDMAAAGSFDETGYGFVVADGMGGNVAGELASSQAIQMLVNLVLRTPDWILRPDDESLADEVLRRASDRYRQVNQALAQQVAAAPYLRGFGTTMTLAASVGADLFLAHLGDSRAYLFRHDTLYRLTRDHTMAQRLADAGVISQEKVATHRLRHVLTTFLGDNADDVQPDVQRVRLVDGDRLLLCTDGMTDLVRDEAIANCLASKANREQQEEQSSAQLCQRLVQQALATGGRDNITVIVADMESLTCHRELDDMTITQTLQQQDRAVQAMVACVPNDWLRIVVNYEFVEQEDSYRDSVLAFYLKRSGPSGQGIETVELRLPVTVLEELVALRNLIPNPSGLKWSTCDLIVDNTGKYNFNFSYDPPKRLNGIFDEESYERFRSYADKYRAELSSDP